MMSLFGPGLVAAVVVAVAGAVCVAVATVAVGCVAAGAETTAGADMPAAPCGIGIGGTAAPPGPGTEAAAGAGVAPAGVGATGASCGVMEALDAAVFASVAVSGVPHVSQNLLPSALSVWQLGQSINGISYESTRLRSRTNGLTGAAIGKRSKNTAPANMSASVEGRDCFSRARCSRRTDRSSHAAACRSRPAVPR